MSEEYVIAKKSEITAVADAVRDKTGKTGQIPLSKIGEDIGEIVDGDKILTRKFNKLKTNADYLSDYAYAMPNRKSFTPPHITSDCVSLTEIEAPKAIAIGAYCFLDNNYLRTIDIPNVNFIGANAFENCGVLSLSFPYLRYIYGNNAFAKCDDLKDIYLPSLKNVLSSDGTNTFYRCSSLVRIQLPSFEGSNSSKSFGADFFKECTSLEEVYAPLVERISFGAFSKCTSLVTVDCPNVTQIDNSVFEDCSSLKEISFPKLTNIGVSIFSNCSSLINIHIFDHLKDWYWGSEFSGCSSLKKLVIPNKFTLSDANLTNCSSFKYLCLLSSEICPMSYSNPVGWSSIFSKQNKLFIIVPNELITAYQESTNWSSWYSKGVIDFYPVSEDGFIKTPKNRQVIASNTNKIYDIEGCFFDEVSLDDFSVTVSSSDSESVLVTEISYNISEDGCFNVSFNANATNKTGAVSITVEARKGEQRTIGAFTIENMEEKPLSSYLVEDVEGASYNFEVNEEGYYESTNKIRNSVSLCKISFHSNGIDNLIIECINSYNNSGNDYGVLSIIDSAGLNMGASAPSEQIYYSFEDDKTNNGKPYDIDYGLIEEGDHFIYIKYCLYSYVPEGGESLQFKVKFVEET